MKNLDPPVFMAACVNHDDCQDSSVRGAIGQYCAKYGQNKCTFKKVTNISQPSMTILFRMATPGAMKMMSAYLAGVISHSVPFLEAFSIE